MELDELKHQLKHKLASEHTGRSDADIAVLLQKRTVSIIGKLKRSLWIEILSCLLIMVIFGYIGLTSNYNSFKIYFTVFTFLFVVFLVLLIYLLQRTTKLSSTLLPVKSNLQAIVLLIEEFTKRYFQFTMALIPVCFTFAFLLGYYDNQPMPLADKFAKHLFSANWKVIVFLVVYMIVLVVVIYYFTKWYLKKLYGKYVVQLKDCINDLCEE